MIWIARFIAYFLIIPTRMKISVSGKEVITGKAKTITNTNKVSRKIQGEIRRLDHTKNK
jgi:hypothetical protein